MKCPINLSFIHVKLHVWYMCDVKINVWHNKIIKLTPVYPQPSLRNSRAGEKSQASAYGWPRLGSPPHPEQWAVLCPLHHLRQVPPPWNVRLSFVKGAQQQYLRGWVLVKTRCAVIERARTQATVASITVSITRSDESGSVLKTVNGLHASVCHYIKRLVRN